MVADIEEMDRIIGQFLDFARDDAATATRADRHQPRARALRRALRARGTRCALAARAAPRWCASSRPRSRASSSNLIDNALAYGAPPVEVTTDGARRRRRRSTSPIAAPGIARADVERLKQPFTRARRGAHARRRRGGRRPRARDRRPHRAAARRHVRSPAARRRRNDRARRAARGGTARGVTSGVSQR